MSSNSSFDWSRLPLGPGVRVLAKHACGLAALEKPAGVLSHPNQSGDEPRSLVAAPYDETAQCFNLSSTSGRVAPVRLWLLHRLDAATSGVILVTSAEAVAVAVRAAFEGRSVSKRYLAVVLGHLREKRTLWRDRMDVRRDAGRIRAAAGADGGGAPAETAVRVVRLVPGPPALTVLELEPHTGRTHQLRHQCARRKLPILGDQNYGDFARNRELARRFGTDRLFLHARSVALEFRLPFADASIRFEAESPPPKDFDLILKR